LRSPASAIPPPPAPADELRRIRVDGSGEELLVRGREGKNDPKQSICDFSSKQFSSDGRYIYFLSPAWATSAALHRYDVNTKALTFVIDANDVIVLNHCKKAENRDNIVVNQHRYFVVAGSYDWYWLFDGAGKKEKAPSANTTAPRRCSTRSTRRLCVSLSLLPRRSGRPH
jgi:hypothetical protein